MTKKRRLELEFLIYTIKKTLCGTLMKKIYIYIPLSIARPFISPLFRVHEKYWKYTDSGSNRLRIFSNATQ